MSEDIWDRGYSVYLTSFWGWSPETWGKVGFKQKGRRETILRETTDPFIMVVYVTKKAPGAEKELLGKVAGFYLVSHQKGHRNEFTAKFQHSRFPERWLFALKAERAFTFLPAHRLHIDDLDPSIKREKRWRTIGKNAEALAPEFVEQLRKIPFVEVPVYGVNRALDPYVIQPPKRRQGQVQAGPANRSGYAVDGEPEDAPKELYVLELEGDMEAFIEGGANGRCVYKVGQSMSAEIRLAFFQRAMPYGRFKWQLLRSTRLDGHDLYPGYDIAVAGENAIKKVLAEKAEWLGGEFYAATIEQLNEAWEAGREEAAGLAVLGP
ncbi:hypothetical protein [Pyruvatibacter mobilis]|uniref:hypothetical protein n=1 Tax=Pyruvatibacter mobilis TaxID=1712261 RepID=UPI003BB1932D